MFSKAKIKRFNEEVGEITLILVFYVHFTGLPLFKCPCSVFVCLFPRCGSGVVFFRVCFGVVWCFSSLFCLFCVFFFYFVFFLGPGWFKCRCSVFVCLFVLCGSGVVFLWLILVLCGVFLHYCGVMQGGGGVWRGSWVDDLPGGVWMPHLMPLEFYGRKVR